MPFLLGDSFSLLTLTKQAVILRICKWQGIKCSLLANSKQESEIISHKELNAAIIMLLGIKAIPSQSSGETTTLTPDCSLVGP